MFAHDSQVFCGQRLGREFGSCSSLFSHPWTEPEIRQRVCEGKVGEKHKKKSKLLVEFLKPTRIKRGRGGGGGKHQGKLYKRKYLLYFISLETLMLAANPSRDRQVACRLNQSMNHKLISALDPQKRPFLLPPPNLLSLLVKGHCYHLVPSVASLLHCLVLCTARA